MESYILSAAAYRNAVNYISPANENQCATCKHAHNDKGALICERENVSMCVAPMATCDYHHSENA